MTELTRPGALLLDFGGVVVATTRKENWREVLGAHIHGMLVRAGCAELTPEEIASDIAAGASADSHWKDSMSRPYDPAELTHRKFWRDFVASDWPVAARELVSIEATPLCKLMGELRSGRDLRDGIEQLFDAADERGVRIGIVSNALCGAVHRDWMDANGLAKRVAVQVYSDEVGVRKPNPEMVWLGARALSVPPEQCWYVGDNFDRDVVCGRRARAGGVILMEARSTYDRPYVVRDQPDAIVTDPHDLTRLLVQAPPRA